MRIAGIWERGIKASGLGFRLNRSCEARPLLRLPHQQAKGLSGLRKIYMKYIFDDGILHW